MESSCYWVAGLPDEKSTIAFFIEFTKEQPPDDNDNTMNIFWK
jgi:hypothetical protein